MRQTRAASLAETFISTAIGFVISVFAQLAVFPWFGIHVTFDQNLMIVAIFTVVSIIRGFWVRRLFEHLRVTGWFA